jgi:hypothetical protein
MAKPKKEELTSQRTTAEQSPVCLLSLKKLRRRSTKNVSGKVAIVRQMFFSLSQPAKGIWESTRQTPQKYTRHGSKAQTETQGDSLIGQPA